jgi:hypothetical protein
MLQPHHMCACSLLTQRHAAAAPHVQMLNMLTWRHARPPSSISKHLSSQHHVAFN